MQKYNLHIKFILSGNTKWYKTAFMLMFFRHPPGQHRLMLDIIPRECYNRQRIIFQNQRKKEQQMATLAQKYSTSWLQKKM